MEVQQRNKDDAGLEMWIKCKWNSRSNSSLWEYRPCWHWRDFRRADKELGEGKLTDTNGGRCTTGGDASQKLHILKYLTFHHTESIKHKMLNTDLSSERRMTICQSPGKALRLYCRWKDQEKQTSIVQTTLGTCLPKKKSTLILNVSDVLKWQHTNSYWSSYFLFPNILVNDEHCFTCFQAHGYFFFHIVTTIL